MDGKWLRMKDAAERIGVTMSALTQARYAGRIKSSDVKKEGREVSLRWPHVLLVFKPDADPEDYPARLPEVEVQEGGKKPSADAPLTGAETTEEATRRLKIEQAKHAQLKRLKEEGESMSREDVRKTWNRGVITVKTRLLALANTAKQRMPHLNPEDVVTIDELVREALVEIANGEVQID